MLTVPILAQAKSFLKMMDIRPIGTVMTKSQYIRQGPSECTEIFMLLSALKISHEVYDNPVPILTCVEARCCSKC